jgi:hypothetical protein
MRVDHDPLGASERDSQNDIGGFPSDARKLDELCHLARNAATVHFYDPIGQADDISCLLPVHANPVDDPFDVGDPSTREGLGIAPPLKQLNSDLVDGGVGGLSTQDGRDEKLERVLVNQGTTGVRVCLAQPSQSPARAPLPLANGH